MGRQAAARAEASSRDSFLAAQKREGQALEARCSWNACSMRPGGAHRRLRRSKFAEHDATMRILRGARDEDTPRTIPRILVPLAERVDEARRFSVVHGGRKILLDHILASPALRPPAPPSSY